MYIADLYSDETMSPLAFHHIGLPPYLLYTMLGVMPGTNMQPVDPRTLSESWSQDEQILAKIQESGHQDPIGSPQENDNGKALGPEVVQLEVKTPSASSEEGYKDESGILSETTTVELKKDISGARRSLSPTGLQAGGVKGPAGGCDSDGGDVPWKRPFKRARLDDSAEDNDNHEWRDQQPESGGKQIKQESAQKVDWTDSNEDGLWCPR